MTVTREAQNTQSDDRSMTTGQAAKALGVSTGTIRNYVKRGQLDGWQLPGGSMRVPAHQVEAIRRGAK